MTAAAGVAILCVDDPSSPRTWSGTPVNLARAMRDAGVEPAFVHVGSSRTTKYSGAAVARVRGAGVREWRRTAYVRRTNSALAASLVGRLGVGVALHMGSFTLPDAPAPWRTLLLLDTTLRQWVAGSVDSGLPSSRALDTFDRLEAQCYRSVDHFFPVSEAAAHSLESDYGVSRSRIDVVGTGLGFGDPPPPKDDDYTTGRVLFVARQRFGDKGADLLREAALLALARHPAMTLVVVGGGHHVADLAGTAGVEIKQDLSLAELHDEFRAASLFVMPARNEPWGLVYLEALAFGLPVMGLDRNAFPEIAGHGRYGFVVPDADPHALADALVTALADPDELRRRGQAGRSHVLANYSWHHVAAAILPHLRPSAH